VKILFDLQALLPVAQSQQCSAPAAAIALLIRRLEDGYVKSSAARSRMVTQRKLLLTCQAARCVGGRQWRRGLPGGMGRDLRPAHRRRSRFASGIRAGHCDRTNDRRAPGWQTDAGSPPPGGEPPAGCHCNGSRPGAIAARGAVTEQAENLLML
jgi:hypothetical protein